MERTNQIGGRSVGDEDQIGGRSRGTLAMRRVLAAVALAVAWHSTTPALADQVEQKDLWEFISPFSACTGDCNIALLAGKSGSKTPMTSVFIHFQGPGTWQWDDA